MAIEDATESVLDIAVLGLAVGVASKTFSLIKEKSSKAKTIKWF